ncbi:ribonuclease D [Marinospirillum insulare]|uniref:Ribonuclease D n=1 Tax=Marinospirillum insulare TaxID=217169 RepID=A0ABQ5ZTZ0_9GAMM|nr:ribonuclease D [Marinospirillum insulare]GLR62897.1 ribonuclease D [Marinospirillum insulare]
MSFDRIWVDDLQHLETLCTGWQTLDELAMDTEFIRTDTFYPRPALLQIGDGKASYLLDVLTLGRPECLRNLLVTGPLKIFHSCSEDLEMLQHWLGVLPNPLVDTQLAVSLVEADSAIGYQRMVEKYLGIVLDKGETRSNWLQRPLTESQQLYAAQDVEFLLPIWHQLKEKLAAEGKLEILTEESRWLLEEAMEYHPQDAWQRCKQAWRLNGRQLAVLQALASWRDEKARQLDKPRNRVASDAQLQLLAEKQPQNQSDFSQIDEIALGWVKRHGDDVIHAIKQTLRTPVELLPTPLSSPRSPEYKAVRKELKKSLVDLASQLGVPVELLAKRKQTDEWLQALTQKQRPEVPENWPKWRRVPLEKLMKHLHVKGVV